MQPGTQQPGIQQGRGSAQQGWRSWDDNMGREYQLQPDQMQRLRDIDAGYEREYNALGATPWTEPNFRPLSDRRNEEIRTVLTPEQYARWNETYVSPTNRDNQGTTIPDQRR